MNDRSPLIRAEQLYRKAAESGQPLLNNIDLEVLQGERIGLVGPTGCGKSTFLRAIAMLDPGVQGRIFFRGTEVQSHDVPSYRRQVIYLPQRPAMVAGTVRENLHLPFELGIATPRDEDHASEMLAQLGKVAAFANQDIDSLSGGERQIVALARALQLEPVALLLDEPTASLDAKASATVEQMIADWHGRHPGRAYLWVSHDRDQVARVAETRWVMDGGTISA